MKTILLAFPSVLTFALALSSPAQTIQPIYVFTNGGFTSPSVPAGGNLNCGPDGNFYGITQYGGDGGFGEIFKLTPSGALTELGSLDAFDNGGDPQGGVSFGPDGNLYGTSSFAGLYSSGTIFEVSPQGGLTTLYSFSPDFNQTNSDGADPEAGVVFGPDGSLYGNTSAGGTNGSGTVFKLAPDGTYTTLYSFDYLVPGSPYTNVSGAAPRASMAFGGDGNLYGATFEGGSEGIGTLFRITTNGDFTALASFVGSNGASPDGPMTTGPDGSVWGTTVNGGALTEGEVFKVTTDGVLHPIYGFNGSDKGSAPQAGVTFGPDGNLYGTTEGAGAYSDGILFRLTTNGLFTKLADFAGTNGQNPETGVTFGLDGDLYGTTSFGGANAPSSAGEVFRFDAGIVLTNPPPTIKTAGPGAITVQFSAPADSTSRLWAATNIVLPLAQWTVLATNPGGSRSFHFTDTNAGAFPQRFYRLTTP